MKNKKKEISAALPAKPACWQAGLRLRAIHTLVNSLW
jgi:hypothetical protein